MPLSDEDYKFLLQALREMSAVQRGMLRFIAKTQIELSFLIADLVTKGHLTADEVKQLDRAVEEKMEQTASALEDADSKRLLDLLRKFEGPVQ